MMEAKVEPRGETEFEPKVSPADRLISSLDGNWLKLTEAAVTLGVSPTTLRRLMRRDNGLKAPSYKTTQGKMLIYLYSEDDMAELRQYFKNSSVPQRRTA